MKTLRHTCETVPQQLELWFVVVRAMGRGIAVLHGGPRGVIFPIRMQKLDNISVWQTYRWKA